MVFPEIARVQFTSAGDGIAVGFKVVKSGDDAIPIRVIKPGDTEEPQGVVIEREINVFDKFNLGLNPLAKKLGQIAQQLEDQSTIRQAAHDFIISHLPTFVYMDACFSRTRAGP